MRGWGHNSVVAHSFSCFFLIFNETRKPLYRDFCLETLLDKIYLLNFHRILFAPGYCFFTELIPFFFFAYFYCALSAFKLYFSVSLLVTRRFRAQPIFLVPSLFLFGTCFVLVCLFLFTYFFLQTEQWSCSFAVRNNFPNPWFFGSSNPYHKRKNCPGRRWCRPFVLPDGADWASSEGHEYW